MSTVLDKLDLLLTPNGYKENNLYSIKPLDNGEAYAWLPGVTGNGFTTPNAAANQVTGDIDLVFYISIRGNDNFQIICCKKSSSTQIAYNFYYNGTGGNNRLEFECRPSSATISALDTFTFTSFTGWVRFTRLASTGAYTFQRSTDPLSTDINSINWTINSTGTLGAGLNLANISTDLRIGAEQSTLIWPFFGTISRGIVRSTIGGVPVVDFNPALYNRATSQTTFTAATGEVWTINGTQTYIKESLIRLPYRRNSIGTRVNKAGLIETLQANIPRIHYPIQGQCPVLLFEPQRTNLASFAEDASNGLWIKLGSTVGGSISYSTYTLRKVQETSTVDNHYISGQTNRLTTNGSYTVSCIAQAAERSNLILYIYNGVEGFGQGVNFNLITGTVEIADPNCTGSIQNLGNGFYRCFMTRTINGNAGAGWGYILATNNSMNGASSSYLGIAGSGLFIGAMQCELGFGSSYIPNNTSGTATREADRISDLISHYGNISLASQGTIFIDYSVPAVATSGTNQSFMLGNNLAAQNQIALANGDNTGTGVFDVLNNNSIIPQGTVRRKLVITIDGIIVKGYVNGVLTQTRINTSIPNIDRLINSFVGLNTLHIHNVGFSSQILLQDEITQLSAI